MFKVTGSDGNTYTLVDTLAAADAIVEMKKLGLRQALHADDAQGHEA